jgi:hypothetical protein
MLAKDAGKAIVETLGAPISTPIRSWASGPTGAETLLENQPETVSCLGKITLS